MPDPETINAAIAANVRSLRGQRGMTLDELAARSKVSRGMLIQIEQGRTNPSINTLNRIAEALGVSIGRLVEVADVPVVRIVQPSEAVTFQHGASSSARLLIGSDAPAILELWDWRLGPGEHYDGDAHPPGTREMLTVLEGELTLTVYGQSHTIGEGAAVVFSADRPHRYANHGEGPVRFVMVVTEPTNRVED
ncbi:transcriptional regulator [Thermobispora bispora]|jgi:transcriptional regulator with XRE-family HTH domain|uniref:Transcriptional regulator, XRE family n=1 Tax=Thermobispora bispora (strain ATCC 19993 / DSM 43833 / CBS 139.67 / JCM 10125 / KCTC 9307 / NBRC 14880 / R51) TaxID=469371 RepID=D6Y653_THEBD|nr:XRE family transcriptional regulator [Thermobispora bispora]ADG89469.1 transcriptional regulator, XRE family [Thermobispora bispora DSM 43833]MBO2475340.1 XRE family transcriptional regulator [Actinomycetales bacterium]MDI9581810.1 XRE family transcriptional regulator [Thermobispora sp.]QSI49104.1 XRE family transcriptional regulator [Thermobispora bispora]